MLENATHARHILHNKDGGGNNGAVWLHRLHNNVLLLRKQAITRQIERGKRTMNMEQPKKQPKFEKSRKEYIDEIARIANKLQTDEAVRDAWIIINLFYDRGR